MPDQIGAFYLLNKIQPPADHGWKIQQITREYVDGDAWQRVAKRADITTHPVRLFASTAAAAKTLKEALYAASGTAGLTVVADGQSYDKIVIIAVRDVVILPVQRRTRCVDSGGSVVAGGAGGRVVQANFVLGRSNQPAP